MKNIIKQILITLLVVIVVLNTPSTWYSVKQWVSKLNPKLGDVSLTTLNNTNLISDFPTTYNANNSALNTGKIDVGTTSVKSITALPSLVTVGTLTSGSLGSGFTTVVTGRGGTGSSTLAAHNVLLGNGASSIGIVNGHGTSGQVLQSQGAGVDPAWATVSVNQSSDYTWTGNHIFSSAYLTLASTTHATSTKSFSLLTGRVHINGQYYNFPSVQNSATSTILASNGSGNLSWVLSPIRTLALANPSLSTSDTASTTLYSVTLPANTVSSAGNSVRVYAEWEHEIASSGSCIFDIQLTDGVTSAGMAATTHGATPGAVKTELRIFATTTTFAGYSDNTGVGIADVAYKSYLKVNTSAQTTLNFRARHNTGAENCFLNHLSVEVLNPF